MLVEYLKLSTGGSGELPREKNELSAWACVPARNITNMSTISITSGSRGGGAGRGRPRRAAAAVVSGDDLVAALLLGDTPNPARAGPTPVGAGSEQKAEAAAKKEQKKEQKQAEAAAKKAAKQAEAAAKKEQKAAEKAGEQLVKETIREEQKEQKAAEKAEKLAAKQAEAAEKKAAKKAEQAKKAPGALLRAAKKAAKAEKAQKAAPGEQVCADELREEPYAPDEPDELEVHVRVFEHEGVRWLKDDDHLLYCPETHDEVGRWDPEQQAVCF